METLAYVPPKLSLMACEPTRIVPLHGLSSIAADQGVSVDIKCDDESGSVLTGNKVRKLEFLLEDARRSGANMVITCGGVQSNHTRATVIAARRLGLASTMLMRWDKADGDPQSIGNLFLIRLSGTDVRYITSEQYKNQRNELMQEVAHELEQKANRAYIIPEGGSNALGCWGYINCLGEIMKQTGSTASTFPYQYVVCPVGSGGTVAGLVLGKHLLGLKNVKILGMCCCDDIAYWSDVVEQLRVEFNKQYDTDVPPFGNDDLEFFDEFKGPAYSVPFPEQLRTMKDAAQQDGVILDPVYTGKTFHGVKVLLERRYFKPNSKVLFIHTGGVFGFFTPDQMHLQLEHL